MLKLKNVSKYYAKDGVITSGFTKINLELHLGEFVVITGESGSGKSTLLNVLSGLDSYEDGEMYINGEETSHYTEEDYLSYRRKYVSNIFQNFNLVNSYTVYQNIELALLMNGKNKKDIKQYVYDLINKVGLTKYKNTVTSKLSGGQKQRVAIARAIANDTPIIVCDEPTGSLDSKASREIIKLLNEISKDKLVIIVTHNKEEVEGYATRLIKMHDGRILEDKIVEKINLDKNIKEHNVSSITALNKFRLGIRNTFNLPVKFVLMFIIFLLITITLITNYGAFQGAEYESNTVGYSPYFREDSDKRILIKKKNGTSFTDNDYKKIEQLDNFESLVKNDLLLDFNMGISSHYLYLDGVPKVNDIEKVDAGRLPLDDNEIIVRGRRDNWYLSDNLDEIFNTDFTLELYDGKVHKEIVKVVGVVYYEDGFNNDGLFEFCLSEKLLNKVSTTIDENYKKLSYTLNDNYLNVSDVSYNGIKVSNKVKEGEVIVSDNLAFYCKDFNCLNNNLKINVENIYVNDNIELKISNTFNIDTVKNILGVPIEEADGYIFVNENDYNKIYKNDIYQSSIFVRELKDLDTTLEELDNLGYVTLSLRNAKYNEGAEVMRILKIFKLIVTVAVIITLFFISYFIIRIIYKSRNSYYTTIRTLGGTKKVCIDILRKELFTLATTAYSLFLLFIVFVNKNVINFKYFKEITKYIGIKEYIIVYLILIFLSIIISNRYGRKIFKNSIIKTYGERI